SLRWPRWRQAPDAAVQRLRRATWGSLIGGDGSSHICFGPSSTDLGFTRGRIFNCPSRGRLRMTTQTTELVAVRLFEPDQRIERDNTFALPQHQQGIDLSLGDG